MQYDNGSSATPSPSARSVRSFSCRFAAAVIAAALAGLATADALNVPDEYPTIQAAIDAAVNGDEIVVAPGTYTGEGNKNVSFLGKAITVRSESGAQATIIDCEGNGRGFLFNNSETSDSVLDGFTIANGWAVNGGGIRVQFASPMIRNCVITNCFGWDYGGGIYVQSGSPTIDGCTLTGNYVDFFGGGIAHQGTSDTTIINSTFVSNIGLASGGGVYAQGTANHLTVRNSVFVGNDGGGVQHDSGEVMIANALFAGNQGSQDGGAIRVAFGSAEIVNTTIFQNSASIIGGVHVPNGVISNSILWNNIGLGGAAPRFSEIADGAGTVVNDSIVTGGWDGAGENILDADPIFTEVAAGNWTAVAAYDAVSGHTIFVDEDASFEPGALAGMLFNPNTDNPRLLYVSDNTATEVLVCGNLVGGYAAGGHLAHAPTGSETYIVYDVRLSSGSPAIDAGDNDAVPPDVDADLDGNDRIVDGDGDGMAVVDLGAYEYQPDVVVGDLTGDGIVGVPDLLALLAAWGDCDEPTNCPADLTGDGSVGVPDLLMLLANWG